MTVPIHQFSDDQAEAYDRAAEMLRNAGIDLEEGTTTPREEGGGRNMAIMGRAGSGKTMLLARLFQAVEEAGLDIVSGDYEPRRRKRRRSIAVLAPTNKAASVLRRQGVPATTIHRILYAPVYDPEYEKLAEWLVGTAERPTIAGMTDLAMDRAKTYYGTYRSIPGALAAAGLRGSDFIIGWKRREEPLDIAFVDEASMLDDRQLDDLKEIFATLLLFGDPAQLAPVNQSGRLIFDRLDASARVTLERIHRQDLDNPILDLAHTLLDSASSFADFEALVAEVAARDPRVVLASRFDADLMARSPALVWRNAIRVRLIQAFRLAHGAGPHELLPGEPLICDGIELPLKHRKKRIDMEARGLIKGAQVIYMGAGQKPGFSRLHVLGAPDPTMIAASIIKIEMPGEEEPFIASHARMGASFLHGAAVTIHKAQGSQWPQVQVFAEDLAIAARTGRIEAGVPLWKRLAYVAITRAEERLIWVVNNRLALPQQALGIGDLTTGPAPLELVAEGEEEFT